MRVCTVGMLKAELRNVIDHGLAIHRGDWFHEWARTQKGTLSFIWFN